MKHFKPQAMKNILTILFCMLTFASVYASGNKKEKTKKEQLNLTIHTDKKGNIQINGLVADTKEVEDWINKCLSNISIQINDSSGEKIKNLSLSLTIKEK